MELVPFCSELTESGSKLDIRAIYRRPATAACPGVTLTSPLPLRRHSDQVKKGFEYVTVATLGELGEIANLLRAKGHDPLAMRSGYDRNGNFDVPKYLALAKETDAAQLVELQAKVDKYGAEMVTDMMRMSHPHFEMPAAIVTTKPKAGK
jgi:hypothetical protein